MKNKKSPAPPAPPTPITATAKSLAELSGWTPRWINELARKGYLPAPANGRFELLPALKGMFQYAREAIARRADRSLEELKKSKLTKENALLELRLGEETKRLVPLAEVQKDWGTIVTTVHARLNQMPGKLSAQLAAVRSEGDARRLVQAELNEALENLSHREFYEANETKNAGPAAMDAPAPQTLAIGKAEPPQPTKGQ
jgi:hypothetical protein